MAETKIEPEKNYLDRLKIILEQRPDLSENQKQVVFESIKLADDSIKSDIKKAIRIWRNKHGRN